MLSEMIFFMRTIIGIENNCRCSFDTKKFYIHKYRVLLSFLLTTKQWNQRAVIFNHLILRNIQCHFKLLNILLNKL